MVALRVAAIVWVIFTASMFIWLWNAHGYDGLVPIYLLIIVSTPSLVFGVIGALFGVSKRRQIDENDPT